MDSPPSLHPCTVNQSKQKEREALIDNILLEEKAGSIDELHFSSVLRK